MRIKQKPNPTKIIATFMMVASTVVMGAFLLMGGMLMGAGGVGLFGEPVTILQRVVAWLLIASGVALAPLAFMMPRRDAQRAVIWALAIVVIDMIGFLIVQHKVPMFGIVYGLTLGIAYKISR